MAPILDMTNKVFAVTGAASGIGRAVACLLYQAGASLSVADIDGKGLRQLEKDLHMSWPGYTGKIMATALDITKSDQVENWVASTTEAMGPLDGGANMAGIASSVSFPDGIIDVTDEDWSRMINVNLTGLFYCIRAQARGDRMKDGGSIVTAGSAMAKQGNPKDGGYAASKHGVLGLSRSMAKELGNERGIRVNCVCPGSIETPMLRKALDRLGLEALPGPAIARFGQPNEVASLVMFLLSDHSAYISGTDLSIDGAWCC